MSDEAEGAEEPALATPVTPDSLELLNDELDTVGIEVEFYFVSGAVIAQAFNPRPETAHVSNLFRPTRLALEVAERIGEAQGLDDGWLNDAIREMVGGSGPTQRYLEMSNIRAFVPVVEYVLAVKAAAMRLGEDFRERDDLRYVLRALNLRDPDEALEIVGRYFGERQLAPETRSDLKALLSS